jgi:FkbM family methyltransferase
MSGTRNWVTSGAYRALTTLPQPLLEKLEQGTRLAMGKGSGSASLVEEVSAALSLVPLTRREGIVALDVGANVGGWAAALLDAEPSANVFCFEPGNDAFCELAARFVDAPNVQCVQLAVAERSGTAQLWADRPGSGLASLSHRKLDHFGIDFSLSQDVTVTTLDDWCQEQNVKPDLIKLDIEGHELSALSAGTQVLTQACVVQFEFGGCNIDSRTYFQDFFYFFQDIGFSLFRLGPRGLIPIPRYKEADEAFVTTNFFALSKHQ